MGTVFNIINRRLMFAFAADDGGSGGGGGSTPPGNNDPNGEVAKAYQKLRDAETERDRLKAENRSLKANKDAKTVEELQTRIQTLESERDTAVKERDEAKNEFGTYKSRQAVETAAREAGFRSPGVVADLLSFRKADIADDNKIKAALDGLAKEDPGMIGAPAPPPPSGGPVNPQNGNNDAGAGSSGFNNAIRQAAGRPVG